jgi:hypothetical protein
VITAVASLYLNVFVLVVQSFVKVSALNALAPTQSEPPFATTQTVVLAIFILIAIIAMSRFRPPTVVAKTLFATVLKNFPGRRRDFRVKMWGPHRLTINSRVTSLTR